jgi:hypothetical protein
MTKQIISLIGWLFAAYTILLQPGCAAPDVDGFVVEGASEVQAWAVQDVIDMWCEGAGQCAYPGSGDSVISFDTDSAIPDGRDGFARVSDRQTWIAVRSTLEGALLRNTIAHELGHHFGCGEGIEGTSIMGWRNSAEEHVLTDADIACAGGAR